MTVNPFVFFLGLVAGLGSGFFGIGGGIIIVPALLFLWKMPYHAATGTSLVALLLPVGSLGVWEFYKTGKIGSSEILLGLLIALGIFVGTYLGAKWALPISEFYLRKSFAVLLFLVSLKTWFSS